MKNKEVELYTGIVAMEQKRKILTTAMYGTYDSEVYIREFSTYLLKVSDEKYLELQTNQMVGEDLDIYPNVRDLQRIPLEENDKVYAMSSNVLDNISLPKVMQK